VAEATHNSHTYTLLTASTWCEAEAAAVKLGGHLVTIDDGDENSFVWSQFGSSDRELWIGYNDMATEGSFVWSSGAASTFTSWDTGEPSGGGENCAAFIPLRPGSWNDFDCTWSAGSGGYSNLMGVAEVP
jgi:hypothetical protein